MHDYPVILCEPFLHFLLPSGMMDKTDGRDRRMAQYYMLYKPRGLLTAKRDARRETVMSCFPEALRETLHPVGRLDRDTEGLLLFTDDGMLDVRLLRPEQHVEKVTVGKLWITEGRKHQVKLMIKAVGGHVFYLKRLAIGPVRLDEALRPGEYRPLTAEELAALMPPATSGGGTAEA